MEENLHLIQHQPKPVGTWVMTKSHCLVDVRSPKEFEEGHIPGAINVPLLDDEERHLVGILYKQQGQSTAIRQGYQFLGPKLALLEEVAGNLRDREILIYCARGGMRSGIMTSLWKGLGLDVSKLEGGYKSYRNWSLAFLEKVQIPNLIVLQGQTGVGKTLVLRQLPNMIDLEGLAQHRGSMFGAIGKIPRTQKQFEGLLIERILQVDLTQPVFIEGESRKIGPISLPAGIYAQMEQAKTLLLTASLETRTQRIVQEYILDQPQEKASVRHFISRLNESLGNSKRDQLLEWFDQEKYHECMSEILAFYYDVKYQHSLKEITFVAKISAESIPEAAQAIQQQVNNWL